MIGALVAAIVLLRGGDPSAVCSFRQNGVVRGEGSALVFVATRDTAAVPAWFPEARPRPEELSAFGQVVRITRYAEVGRPGATERPPPGFERAVLVPWSVSAGCRTIGWGRSSHLWVSSSEPAFVEAKLRPRSAWANGLPTFDVHVAYQEPFPHEPWLRAMHFVDPPRDRAQILTAEEYFQLYTALPTFEEWRREPRESLGRVRGWLGEHPAMASRYPASALLAEALDEVEWAEAEAEHARLWSMHPPLAGTYRLDVSVNDDPFRTLFVRTRAWPNFPWHLLRPDSTLTAAERVRRRDGYRMPSSVASEVGMLPAECRTGAHMVRESLMVLDPPQALPNGARLWQGKIELDLVVLQFPRDTVLRRMASLDSERTASKDASRERIDTPARFVELPDGSVSVEQSINFGAAGVVRVRGDRVSLETVGCARPATTG